MDTTTTDNDKTMQEEGALLPERLLMDAETLAVIERLAHGYRVALESNRDLLRSRSATLALTAAQADGRYARRARRAEMKVEDTCTAKQAEAGCAYRFADVWHDRFRRPKASSLRAAVYRGMARTGVGGIVDQGDALITRKRYEEMQSNACFYIDRGGHALVFTRLASTIPSAEGDGEIVAQGTDPVTNKTVYLIVID